MQSFRVVDRGAKCFNEVLRRFASILLLVVFSLPSLLPLLLAAGQDADAGLPACCRRDGKHHCMMSTEERGSLSGHYPRFSSPVERCPYSSVAVIPVFPKSLAAPVSSAMLYGVLFSHARGAAQTEANRRVSLERSHQKRGPPGLTIS